MIKITEEMQQRADKGKGYGVLVRIDKIRGYSGFNMVQER